MKLFVDRLTRVPEKHSFSNPETWWGQHRGLGRATVQPSSPFRFDLMARTTGEDLLLEGSAEADFEMECSRCVARYRHDLREAFRLVLEPAGERVPADPEGASALRRDGITLSDELELGWYRGAEINLDSYLAEVVALAMPVQPLCRNDCAGLCPECGANRNEADCGCSNAKPNSPFAVLASLRIGQSGGKL